MKKYVILAAGGSGTRMQSPENKIFISIKGCSVLERSIRLFDGLADGMMVVCRESDMPRIQETAAAMEVSFPVFFTSGGNTRQQSVLNGLKALCANGDDIVMVHDAARCLTPRSVILDVIESCREHGSGIPGIPAVSTMKYSRDHQTVSSTADRKDLYEVQTPQAFTYEALVQAYLQAERDGFIATDDASVMEHTGSIVRITPGARSNLKITEKDDILMAEAFLSAGNYPWRVGMGYDVHKLVPDRKLILCGTEIPHHLGLLGHSDADVALHALMDAMLGAASLGDIGRHFPDSSEKYRGISSLVLLSETSFILKKAGYRLVNADITIAAQRPKISPFIPEMTENICKVLQCAPEQISIKATTTEKLGFEGREEGISAQAVCMLIKTDQ